MSALPELLGYIKSMRSGGASDEAIRRLLLGTGWDDAAITEAFTTLGATAVPSPEQPERQVFETQQFSSTPNVLQAEQPARSRAVVVVVIVLILAVISAAGVFAYYSFVKNQKGNAPSVALSTSTTDQPPAPDPLAPVRAVFENLKLVQDRASLKQLLSKESIALFEKLPQSAVNLKDSNFSSYEYISGSLGADGRTASIKSLRTDKDDNKKEETLYFVIEDGMWKFDFARSIEEKFKPRSSGATLPPATGTADLAVLDIITDPVAPHAGDKNTKVTVRVKNMGTAEVRSFNYKFRINEFYGGGGTQFGVLSPGGKTNVTIPYDAYVFGVTYDSRLKKDAGTYAFYINVDYDNKVGDKNRSNNEFTKEIFFN